MDSRQRSGLLLVLISAAGYSFFAIFTKTLYDAGFSQPLDILIWRFLLATPITWLWLSLRQGPSGGGSVGRGRPMMMGLLFGVVAAAAFFALERLPVSLYTVLIYTYPAMVALGGLFFGERLPWRGWVALGLTLLGVALTIPDARAGSGEVDPLGVALVLFNATTYALYILLSGRVLRGQSDHVQASAWSITGSFVFVVGLLVLRGTLLPASLTAWAGLLGLAVISTIIPIFTFYAGLQRLGAGRAAIISTVEPVLTLLWAVLLRGETLLPAQMLGAACILGSVVLLQLRRERAGARLKPAEGPL